MPCWSAPQARSCRRKDSSRVEDGDPWVSHESPVSSIDQTVTRAVIERGLA